MRLKDLVKGTRIIYTLNSKEVVSTIIEFDSNKCCVRLKNSGGNLWWEDSIRPCRPAYNRI
jgi:hypothetical protein